MNRIEQTKPATAITSYWFVMVRPNSPPVAMFSDFKQAQEWRNEHYPDATLEKFALEFEN